MTKILLFVSALIFSLSLYASTDLDSADKVWESLPDIPAQTFIKMAQDLKNEVEVTGQLTDEEMIEKILRENLPERFTKIDVNLKDDNFTMTTKYKLFWFFKIKVKLEGKYEFDYDSFTLRINLEKAHALLFSIRGKIFNYIEKMEHPAIGVERPFIIIDLFGV